MLDPKQMTDQQLLDAWEAVEDGDLSEREEAIWDEIQRREMDSEGE